MATSKKQQVSELLMSMTYEELIEFAGELVGMQANLKEDTDGAEEWHPEELHGRNGLANMLYSWAESCD